MLRKCSDDPQNEWRRTAPRPPLPCWIARARSDAGLALGKPRLTLAISPWLPARDFRRKRAGRPRSPVRSSRHRTSWTPRSASPRRDPGALPRRHRRSVAPPRPARLVKALTSWKDFGASFQLPVANLRGYLEFYRVRERLFEPFPLPLSSGVGGQRCHASVSTAKGSNSSSFWESERGWRYWP